MGNHMHGHCSNRCLDDNGRCCYENEKPSRKVTIAVMMMTDGYTTYYAIYQGRLKGKKKMWFDINARDTKDVAVVHTTEHPSRSELKQFYYNLARPYASEEFPAFSF